MSKKRSSDLDQLLDVILLTRTAMRSNSGRLGRR